MSNILEEAFKNAHIAFFWGVLAESTISKNQRELHVYVPELSPLRDGDISGNISKTVVKKFNVVTQSEETVDITSSRTIVAEYLGFQSGYDVPDMYKGQQVLVMNYARSDKWFWIPLDHDDWLKPFEHLRLRCADMAAIYKTANAEEDTERASALSDDNTYYIDIDTKYHKRIMMSTAASDGEKYRYFFRMDANEHVIELWDNLSSDPSVPHNMIKIESDPTYYPDDKSKGRITIMNESGSSILMEGPDITIYAPRDISIISGRHTLIDVGKDLSATVKGDSHVKLFGDFIKMILGKVKAEIVGVYECLFGDDKKEEVKGSWTTECTNRVASAKMRMVNISGADALVANMITITAQTDATISAYKLSLGQGQFLTIASYLCVTATPIHGCVI